MRKIENDRVLIIDDSNQSKEAIQVLRNMEISFVCISREKIAQTNFKLPTLLAPEGKFEGIFSVKMYSEAERNGFHKMIAPQL